MSRLKVFILVFLLVLTPFQALAQEPIDPSFDPGLLISDEAFGDVDTFGSPAGLQQFLESKGSVLARTDAEFLIKLREPGDANYKAGLDDPNPNLGRLRSAAELIYDAAKVAGINPQVLVVTLQKEQSLITKNFTSENDLQRALDRALGFGCPDSQPCQAIFLGFYSQLFGSFDAEGNRWLGAAKSLMRSFNFEVNGVRVGRGPLVDVNNNAYGGGPFVRASRRGDTVTFENTLNGFAGVPPHQTVTLKNFATAALYRYTPHVFNGNYNFWRFYQAWFKYPNGTVLKLLNDPTLWVVDNGQRRPFSVFVAQQRNINMGSPVVVSPTELNSYIEGSRLAPLDGTLIKSENNPTIYLIQDGQRHTVTQFTAQQRKINLNTTVTLSQAEVDSYAFGSVLLPLDGTLIKSETEPTVYVMLGSQRRPLTLPIFQQRNYRFRDVITLPTNEVADIPLGNIMPPLDGSLVKSNSLPAVYLVENGIKRIISGPVFIQRGYSFGNIIELSDFEINSLSNGLPLPPLDDSLIKTDDDLTVYLVRQGIKIPVTATIFVHRGLNIKPIMILSRHEVETLPTHDFALPPQNGALVKSTDDPTIYLVEQERLRPLMYDAFVNRSFSFSQVLTIDAGEMALFEKGEIISR